MKKVIVLLTVMIGSLSVSFSQLKYSKSNFLEPQEILEPQFKISTRKFGALLGIQRGKYTFFEMGVEKQWKTVKLIHPPTIAVKANLEYNFKYNLLGYKMGVWSKTGRVALTYGINLAYMTDFEQSKIGGGPAIGFKLLGFHLENGYNLFIGPESFTTHNTFYMSLRYFFINKRKIEINKKGKKNGKKKKDKK